MGNYTSKSKDQPMTLDAVIAECCEFKNNEYFYKKQNLLGWYLYQVLMPAGSSTEYDYASVNVTSSLASLLDFPMSSKEIYKKV